MSRENNKIVYTVPLIEDRENYMIPVEPGVVYRCSPTVGIDELELIDRESEGTAADDTADAVDAAADDEGDEGGAADGGTPSDEAEVEV